MSASKPSNELNKQVADLTLFAWQSIVQRGNRIIVIEEFFATTFSPFFRSIHVANYSLDRYFVLTFNNSVANNSVT